MDTLASTDSALVSVSALLTGGLVPVAVVASVAVAAGALFVLVAVAVAVVVAVAVPVAGALLVVLVPVEALFSPATTTISQSKAKSLDRVGDDAKGNDNGKRGAESLKPTLGLGPWSDAEV